MSDLDETLKTHLETGITTTCRCWAVTRTDGRIMGFTDHDRDLAFDGITFQAGTGLSALAVQQTTGLSVDNTEALGALTDAAITEADIEAGRFDGAEIRAWLVNWQDVAARHLQFRGTIGEIRRGGGAFRAELRGLTEKLNVPLGRVYQKPCSAVLGDGACRFDLDTPGYSIELPVQQVADRRVFRFDALDGFTDGWFRHGMLRMKSGAAESLRALIKRDRMEEHARVIELWHPLRAAVVPGDLLRLEAGCDKRFETCRLKFNNAINHQGFPDIPGDDWIITDPGKTGALDGGSRRS
ncbi:MAG: DUF2163 domain-containing protein [Roseovarius sp.]|nr:DUF2163 domain-containing protein [Roseovarius sp.]